MGPNGVMERNAARLVGPWLDGKTVRQAATIADVTELTARRHYELFDWARAYDCDPLPPRYTGPNLIGKPAGAIRPMVSILEHDGSMPIARGDGWIGKRAIERRVPRGHIDHLPASDTIGA